MPDDRLSRVGVVVNRVTGVDVVLRASRRVEDLGYGAAWLTNGGPEDCMPLLGVIALQCRRLRLGTSVVQTYPRHPVVLATEANVIDQLGPGRLRLGVGPSHDAVMETLGIRRVSPLQHLREYVEVLQLLFSGKAVDYQGQHYQVRSALDRPVPVSVMVGALQPKTFELAGGLCDGAITWLCPPQYLATMAIPALVRGADRSNRERPPLAAHLAVCVHHNARDVREAVRAGVPNIRFPAYQRMLVRAGFDEAAMGVWTDRLVDQVIAWGSPDRVASRIDEMFQVGADEVLIRPLGVGESGEQAVEHTIEALAGQLS